MFEVIKMKVLQITTRGIKNINKDLTIPFSNLVVSDGIKNINSVRGIYGYNGAGKSAFITSIELYRRLMIDRNYLLNDFNQRKLTKLLNFSINEFYFESIFFDDKGDNKIYKHSLLLSYDELERRYYISKEYFGSLEGRSLNDKEYSAIFTADEKLKLLPNVDKMVGKFYVENFNKFHGSTSINSLFLRMLVSVTAGTKNGDFDLGKIDDLLQLFIFVMSLHVYLLNEDRHEPKAFDASKIFDLVKKVKDDEEKLLKSLQLMEGGNEFEDLVSKDQVSKYEKEAKRQEEFIKIFKPELNRIELTKKVDGNVIHCRKVFDYGKGVKVDLEYESSGIKHLLQLHRYLQNYIVGQIVFIDEMDVNINSVYLCKLIDFLINEGKGQLCFTSHNLEPMNSLKNSKAGICAIGYERNIDIWTKLGNKSPINEYMKGDFEHSPFNVEAFDFYAAFELEKDK